MATIVQQTNGEKTIYTADEYKLVQQQLSTMTNNIGTNASQLANIVSQEITLGDNNYPRLSVETNDSPRIQRAINDLSTGGKLIFPYQKSLTLATTITIDPSKFVNYPLIIDLNGANITFNGTGFAFDLLSNGWPNWNMKGKVFIFGKNASIYGNSSAAGAIRMTDSIGYEVDNLYIQNFTAGTGIQIYISDGTHWAEENLITNCWVRSTLVGYQTLIVGNGNVTSMNHTMLRNCRFTAEVNNAIGFDLHGNHSRSILDSCGGWLNQSGATGTTMFHLDGWFPQAIMVAPWCDGGKTQTNCITFGPGYITGSTADKKQIVTITNANADYFLIPTDGYLNINLISYTKTQPPMIYHDEMHGTGDQKIASMGLVAREVGVKYLSGQVANTPQYWTRNIQPMKTILSVNLIPYINSTTDSALPSAVGNYGVATFGTDSNGNTISITFYQNPTAARTVNFFYEVIGIPAY